jgi:hypothetical protein
VLGFLGERRRNESRRAEQNHEELYELSHECRISTAH